MKEFAGKVAFVTGGGSGLGLGIAKVFAQAGCKVVIADIRQDHIDQALSYFKDTSATVHAIQLDIADRMAYRKAADEVDNVFGQPPQLLFNNAGVNTFGPTEASTYEDWDWLFGVNLHGVVNGMQTFVPRMIEAKKGGHIVSTSSLGGFRGSQGAAIYSAAKAAVINMMESYQMSLEPYGIGVSVCCPANIASNIAEATYTRPEHLQNTGYIVTDSSIDALRRVYAGGMDPMVLANYIKQGVENNQLYIIPYPEAKPMLEKHFQDILNAVPSIESDPEGVRQRQKAMQDWIKDQGEGFAQANPDAVR